MSLPGYEDIPGLTVAILEKQNEFVARLRKSHSRTNPASGRRIAKALGISHVAIRALRRACWKAGYPVGSCATGYYYARLPEDLDPTVNHIRARAIAEADNLSMVLILQAKLRTRKIIDDTQSKLAL